MMRFSAANSSTDLDTTAYLGTPGPTWAVTKKGQKRVVSEFRRRHGSDSLDCRIVSLFHTTLNRTLTLGRPKGPGKSKLDAFRPEIESLLANGSTQKFIAQRYRTTEANLHNWLKKHGLKTPRPQTAW
jgi:hypothetical protein